MLVLFCVAFSLLLKIDELMALSLVHKPHLHIIES